MGSLRGTGDDEMKQGPILWPGAPRSPQRTWDENDGAEPLRTFSLDAQDMAPERAIRGTQNFVEFGWAFHIKDTNIRVFAGDSPQMEPFALQLQFCCPVIFQGTQLRGPPGGRRRRECAQPWLHGITSLSPGLPCRLLFLTGRYRGLAGQFVPQRKAVF